MTWSNNLHAFYAFQIHWLSIINSVVLVFLLIGFVVIILVNTCRSLWYYCWLVHVLIERIYMAVPRYEMSFGLLNSANEWIFFSQEHKFNMNMFCLLLKHQWNYHTILPFNFFCERCVFYVTKATVIFLCVRIFCKEKPVRKAVVASQNAGCFLRLPEEFSLTKDSLQSNSNTVM